MHLAAAPTQRMAESEWVGAIFCLIIANIEDMCYDQ